MKLRYKIFLIFLLSGIVGTGIMFYSLQYLASNHFKDFIAKDELNRLSGVCDALKAEYRNRGNWEHIRQYRLHWDQIIRDHQPDSIEDFPIVHTGPPPPGMPRYEDPNKPLPPSAPILSRRLTLYDGDRNYVTGRREEPENQDVREIIQDGKTIGWLGLSRRKVLTNPLQSDFLYEQKLNIFLSALVYLTTALAISILLSHGVLKRINHLIKGIHALASRKLHTRLEILSSDELGLVAIDFNEMASCLEMNEFRRRQWLSDISHELRTPLSVLRGEIEAYIDGMREVSKESLASMREEILVLSKLVNDLHSLTAIENELISMEKRPIPILMIVKNILDVYKPLFIKKKICVEASLDLDKDIFVNGDPDRLGQIFFNLFENSLRYTDSPGRFAIHFKIERDIILLILEDSTPGIPDSAQPYIFDRFYRVDHSRSKVNGGSGLGLTITRAIIEGHNGSISPANSSLGGLRINIRLPLVTNN